MMSLNLYCAKAEILLFCCLQPGLIFVLQFSCAYLSEVDLWRLNALIKMSKCKETAVLIAQQIDMKTKT